MNQLVERRVAKTAACEVEWPPEGVAPLRLVDTYEGEVNDPRTLHKYAYCSADPVNQYDPSGQAGELTTTQLVIAIAAVVTVSLVFNLWRAMAVVDRFSGPEETMIREAQDTARERLSKAFKLIDSDQLWAKTKAYYQFPGTYMKLLFGNRDYYRGLLTEVFHGLSVNPPRFSRWNPNLRPNQWDDPAYVAEKGGEIYLRWKFFTGEKIPGWGDQAAILVHEYGRVYLWDYLPDDEANKFNTHDPWGFDHIVDQLQTDYSSIAGPGK